MTTRLTFPIAGREAGVSLTIDVAEDFDEVASRVAPEAAPSSALEDRRRSTFTTPEGNRVLAKPGAIFLVEEVDE